MAQIPYKIITTLLSFFLIISCTKQAVIKDEKRQQPSSSEKIKMVDQIDEGKGDSDDGIYHFVFVLSSAMPAFSAELDLNASMLFIFQNEKERGFPFQTIDLTSVHFDKIKPQELFQLHDFNFDGYQDLAINRLTDANGNIRKYFWLFDPTVTQFKEHNLLSSFVSPIPDPKSNTISFHERIGSDDLNYISGQLEWRNGTLTLTKKIEQTFYEDNPEILLLTVYVLDGSNEIHLASKVKIVRLADGVEKHCLLQGDWKEFDANNGARFASSEPVVKRSDGRDGRCE